ncbi:Cobalamin-binding protein [Sphingomonas sp. EC-HK361]|uniref:cobalamin B12-binding domain-containing protein n=1 Tax=Sphingomonas sp. EC-HK361 TaxID=2038397 RepID=UPI00125149B5|nr:cobalamin-dependent protein [Sphingomonas sp. EC-HK361]VVS99965.1 Cobalamin-binding protein [Sphingomonas sp. EC-HK361]
MASSSGYGQAAPTSFPRDRYRDNIFVAEPMACARAPRWLDAGRSLTSLIEGQIIPRLIVAHPSAQIMADDCVDLADEVLTFAPLALHVEADALIEHVEAYLVRGATVEALLVDLLAPAARRLGEYWEEDRCDFVDVTMGLWRLQEVVHELAARGPVDRRHAAPRALFAAMPGDQHSFGAVVIEDVFARAGWATDRLGDAAMPELLDRAGEDWFDVIGLTVSCDSHTAALPSAIVALRNVSRNPRVVVMVGGRVFAENPRLASDVGADGTARDARSAVKMAQELIDAVAREVVSCS